MSALIPDWPCPSNVHAAVSRRRGGVSASPWNSLNLAYHVGDSPVAVQQNWQLLSALLRLPSSPQLLQQVHGTDVVIARDDGVIRLGDGCYSDQPGVVCTVMTADCLPILLCNSQGTEVAALHAGWRGLADGIVASGIEYFHSPPQKLLAWLGPAISSAHFEVGEDVLEAFIGNASSWGGVTAIETCFRRTQPGHWLCDLYGLARLALGSLGISHVYGGQHCTFAESEHYYSFRRDGQTGRMASLIWIS
ncbi:MAG: peptidoglycan editing factor PgeF [Gammaproteobacteria bacterium]|nr:MAG: peptidoglycan editing factor PgeF [Gammaproteobacteria bacterium]